MGTAPQGSPPLHSQGIGELLTPAQEDSETVFRKPSPECLCHDNRGTDIPVGLFGTQKPNSL
ncbi:MAG: hypothetical protein DWH91_08295 [Planctomycetota bacterium]|nr:MAG: hypothetical protein DWH91_08295 [Planctomycetota bacterium]